MARWIVHTVDPAPHMTHSKVAEGDWTFEEAKRLALAQWEKTLRTTYVSSGPHMYARPSWFAVRARDPYHPERGAETLDRNTYGVPREWQPI